jgi:pantoate--beta-alanine ligase
VNILKTVAAVRRFNNDAGNKLVLVPTMGALHAGHAALIQRARKLAGRDGRVVVSIFVNPTQFGPKEDFSRYPRPFHADKALCEKLGVDAIFYPDDAEMYPLGYSTYVEERTVSAGLCGASRPGHFRGVCTVVLKLFTIVQPSTAVFGLKDYQQCKVIERMVRDLNLPVRLVFIETLREPDGLALSSRNVHLSSEERKQAPVLREALLAARDAFCEGERQAAKLRAIVQKHIGRASLARIDYIEVVDGISLAPARTLNKGDTLAAAVFFGRTRLIDNIQLTLHGA